MRGDDPDLAARWRLAQRTVLSPAMAKGYRAVDVSPEGWLRLSRPNPRTRGTAPVASPTTSPGLLPQNGVRPAHAI